MDSEQVTDFEVAMAHEFFDEENAIYQYDRIKKTRKWKRRMVKATSIYDPSNN